MAPIFVPGPVDVAPEVAAKQTRAMLPHRSKAYEEIFHRAERNARTLFGTGHRVFITASSGTGMQEAAVRNFASSKVLSCANGAFGDRWYQVATSNGKDADKLEAEWGQPINPEMVSAALKQSYYEMITVVHNETSIGLQNPVMEIAAAVHDASPETIICVDAVSSMSGIKLEMDEWGVDFILTSSQKALALPPGLALAAASDRALERANTVENRGWYFDLVKLEKSRLKNSTPATSAVSLVYALDFQLQRIIEEGLENRFARHIAMAGRVQEWALDNGFGLYAASGYRSQTVTTIVNQRNLDISELNSYLLQRGMRIANGYGPLKNKTFRIAHMGELQMDDINTLLHAIEGFMA